MKKLEALKIGGVQREKKKKFRELEFFFLSLLFFHYFFSFALQR
jgi:hypothetical protein